MSDSSIPLIHPSASVHAHGGKMGERNERNIHDAESIGTLETIDEDEILTNPYPSSSVLNLSKVMSQCSEEDDHDTVVNLGGAGRGARFVFDSSNMAIFQDPFILSSLIGQELFKIRVRQSECRRRLALEYAGRPPSELAMYFYEHHRMVVQQSWEYAIALNTGACIYHFFQNQAQSSSSEQCDEKNDKNNGDQDFPSLVSYLSRIDDLIHKCLYEDGLLIFKIWDGLYCLKEMTHNRSFIEFQCICLCSEIGLDWKTEKVHRPICKQDWCNLLVSVRHVILRSNE